MPDPALAIGGLAQLLQQLQLQRAAVSSSAEASQAQVEMLLNRISLLTDTLRRPANDELSKAAARLLLADVSMVAACLRGDVTSTGGRLETVLEQVQAILKSSAGTGSDLT